MALDRFVVIAQEYNKNETRLLQLLNDACIELRAQKGTISLYSHYNSYGEFIDHIQNQITHLQQHRAKMNGEFKVALVELYEIFLPTSDWDEAAGSFKLANEITTILIGILG